MHVQWRLIGSSKYRTITDENTLILSDFKGIGTPSRTGIVFISKQAEDIYFEQRGNIKENEK